MIKLTQAGSMNRGPLGSEAPAEQYVLYLSPESIESIAANPNYKKTEYAAQTVIRMKVTGAIHYVNEESSVINDMCNTDRIGLLEEQRMRR